jgi:23S rRNA G2445 N2-methylase RlmL
MDPMCGSGTIAIEAALVACNTAPGLFRYPVSSSSTSSAPILPLPLFWKDLTKEEKSDWTEVYNHALEQDQRGKLKKEKLIFVNDVIAENVRLARATARKAGVDHLISFSHGDVEDIQLDSLLSPSNGNKNNNNNSTAERTKDFTIIANPPWDLRLAKGAKESWEKLNSFLQEKDNYQKIWRSFILSGNPSLAESITKRLQKSFYLNAANQPMELLVY